MHLLYYQQPQTGKEMEKMQTPIIPIKRAPERLIQALIESGILVVTEDGLKVKEDRD